MSPIRCVRVALLGGAVFALAGLVLSAVAAEPSDEVDLTLVSGGGEFTNSVGVKFVRLKAGKFLMGAGKEETAASGEERPQHQVEFTKEIYLGIYEVTQKQYAAVVGKNPSHFSQTGSGKAEVGNVNTDDFPVEQVNFNDTQTFLGRLNALAEERKYNVTYRLPTEAEWEYACRAGTTTSYSFGNKIDPALCNYDQSKVNRTRKVGSYKANAWGIHDMHGNVWEYCNDRHAGDYYAKSPLKDPMGPAVGQARALRGGGWRSTASSVRASSRNSYTSGEPSVGFRIVAVPK